MTEIKDYPSRIDAASKRFETFSYLPEMDAARIRDQIAYIIGQGWSPAIEHVEPARANENYWYMWKLPLFGETDVDAVLRELDECRAANPGHHVRLVGYDRRRQTLGTAIVVHRGDGGENRGKREV